MARFISLSRDLADFSQNPELILMRAEGDEDEADIEESMWFAATHATSTHESTDKE